MRKQEAIEKFRNPYSCAQTIYAAYAETPTQEGLDNMKNFSGGRAPDNACGALYAATQICPGHASEIIQYFKENAGDTRCKELKTQCKTSCHDCVRIAAEALDKFNG